MPFLSMKGIVKRFGATVALDGVDFEVERGEVHALVGENGSGKSTLMRVLAGAIRPDEGEMAIDGRPYNPKNPADGRSAGIAMIYQELALCQHLSVRENILLGVEPTHAGVIDRGASRGRAREALAKLGYPDLDVEMETSRYPIASQQVIEIARAVVLGSSVVILDQPTSSLTQGDVQKLFDVIETLRNDGHAVIYISHFLDEIQRIADRMTVLRDGKLIGVRKTSEVTNDQIVTLMVGRRIESIYPRSDRAPGEVLLRVSGLHGKPKPEAASFELRRGEVFGIAGLNGSGRTELLRTIFGLDPVKSGEIRVGAFTGSATPTKRWAEGLGMLSENRKEEGLALSMTIADNMTMTKLRSLGSAGIVSNRAQNEKSAEWIGNLSVKCQGPTQTVGALSGGNQQKVAIARLMVHDVDVLLLDEPTRGIDVGSKEQIYQLIDRAALDGKAVLMVSSYLPELLGVCDRIAVMHKGVLGQPRAAESLDQETIISEAAGA
jgi:ribose transport system ATP-binding protein